MHDTQTIYKVLAPQSDYCLMWSTDRQRALEYLGYREPVTPGLRLIEEKTTIKQLWPENKQKEAA